MRRYASCAVNEPGDDDIEQKLAPIRNAGGFDLTVPGYRRGLEEAALLAGASSEQVRKARDENENWPS